MYQWKQERTLYRIIIKFTTYILIVFSVTAIISAVWVDHRPRLIAFYSAFSRMNWLCTTFVGSCPIFFLLIFVRVFLYESLFREFFRFPQVLNKILSSGFSIFPYSISLLYYFAQSNSMK